MMQKPTKMELGMIGLVDLDEFSLKLQKQALQKGPKFGTWSQMGPKCQNGPKKVPILLPSPKFLILPSDDAEKGRHIAVSHCCVLFGHNVPPLFSIS